VITAGFEAYGWYYNHYAWPRKIQIGLLGEVIVTHDTLRSFEGVAHYGQGMFRWKYAAPRAANSAWMKYCPTQDIEHCQFIRHGAPTNQVDTSVSYTDGVVTIEEWWM
jgi:hypothetical protein